MPTARPQIADVQCSRLKFEPGDCIVVRVYSTITLDQKKKIEKGIQRWAGVDVSILVIDGRAMELEIQKKKAAGTNGIVLP